MASLRAKPQDRDSHMDLKDSRGITILREGADKDAMLADAATVSATGSAREDSVPEPDWSSIMDWPFDDENGLT